MRKSILLFLTVVFLSIVACSDKNNDSIHSAYYWTTKFELSKQKTDFISKHNVKRLYTRFFDVVMDTKMMPVPNATIQFVDTVPDSIEIVPTVFIMNECMMAEANSLAKKTVKRILQMCKTHHIRNVNEIQIDCDWTNRTQDQYFDFLEKTRKMLKENGLKLSATIRLHQLALPVPPVDRGVLMLYNTGDVTDRNVKNPILDFNDVKPYMRFLKNYELTLVAAYPVFSWDVIFRGRHFVGIKHNESEYLTSPADTIITYKSEADEIRKVKQLVDQVRPKTNNEIIIYDLSDKNLKNHSAWDKILTM